MHQAAVLDLQMKARAYELAGQERLAQKSGAWQGLSASMAAEASIGDSYKWVNAVRALTPPLLTLLLWLMTRLVYLGASADARAGIVETTAFAATAATLWWFGDGATGGRCVELCLSRASLP